MCLRSYFIEKYGLLYGCYMIVIQLPEAETRHRAQFEFEDETPRLKTRKLKSSLFVGTDDTLGSQCKGFCQSFYLGFPR